MLNPVSPNPYASIEDVLRSKDARTAFGLSGDQNLPQGQRSNIQFALDNAAGELESSLYGRVPLPLPVPRVAASGQITVNGVPSNAQNLFISDGLLDATLIFTNSPSAITDIDTSSANAATIAGLIGAAIPLNRIGISAQNVGRVLNLQNDASGVEGNVAITTTAPLVSVVGMSGGGLQVPFVLRKWVCAKACESLFGRRSDLPEQIRQSIVWADKWMEDWRMRKVSIPGVGRSAPGLYQGAPIGTLVCMEWNVDWSNGQALQPLFPPNQS